MECRAHRGPDCTRRFCFVFLSKLFGHTADCYLDIVMLRTLIVKSFQKNSVCIPKLDGSQVEENAYNTCSSHLLQSWWAVSVDGLSLRLPTALGYSGCRNLCPLCREPRDIVDPFFCEIIVALYTSAPRKATHLLFWYLKPPPPPPPPPPFFKHSSASSTVNQIFICDLMTCLIPVWPVQATV